MQSSEKIDKNLCEKMENRLAEQGELIRIKFENDQKIFIEEIYENMQNLDA